MRILVVDDDPLVRALVQRGLTAEGFEVEGVESGGAGMEIAGRGQVDAVILDLALPDIDGLDVARTLRAAGNNVPIIMLSGRDTLDHRLAGFSAGADDYLVKPFAFQELLMRLRAVARRTAPARIDDRLVVGDLTLDRRAREVYRGSRQIELAPKEFAVLEFLMEHPGQAISRAVLLERVWDYSFDGFSNVVDVSIRRLRRAISPDDPDEVVQTVHGVGYRIRA